MRIHLAVVLLSAVLVGCATPQMPVQLNKDSLGSKSGRVGVAMTALPKVDTELPGAGCLLCLAAASVANSSLTTHARTLPHEDLPNLKNELANVLRKKGVDAMVVAEELKLDALPDAGAKGANVARKDFSALQQKYKIDKLLVIDINALGFVRNYSAYIPTSDPKAQLRGMGYLVNLKTNTYEWYEPVFVLKSADKAWDEPPKFPGLTNAYYQVIELGKDNFLKALAQ
jgi:hypothetical protein